MPTLSFENIKKSFGTTKVISGVDLKIDSGDFLVLVGPSGCGKSTLLRMIAGLESPTSGEIKVDGQTINNTPPKNRNVAMVFQNYALYPHMTVAQNIGFALTLAKVPKEEISRRVQDAANKLGISDQLAKKPGQLSGGQKQRVAIGRAIVRRSEIFLFDEPLSNLDAQLRVKMRAEISELHRDLGITSVYVTHDQTEAMTMADQIAVMNKGVIEQFGRPMDLYRRPATKFVAGFIGTPAMNFFAAKDLSGIPEAHIVGVRPEHVSRQKSGLSLGPGEVRLIEPLGSTALIHYRHDTLGKIVAEQPTDNLPSLNDKVELFSDLSSLHYFDHEERRIDRE